MCFGGLLVVCSLLLEWLLHAAGSLLVHTQSSTRDLCNCLGKHCRDLSWISRPRSEESRAERRLKRRTQASGVKPFALIRLSTEACPTIRGPVEWHTVLFIMLDQEPQWLLWWGEGRGATCEMMVRLPLVFLAPL